MIVHPFEHHLESGWKQLPSKNHDSSDTLILVFFAPEYASQSEPLFELSRQFPQSTIVGCSTSGEITGTRVSDRSASACLLQFESTSFKVHFESIETTDRSYAAGKAVLKALDAPDLKGVFLLCDGLLVNGSSLVDGANSIVQSRPIPLAGGLAGDGSRFGTTWLLRNGALHNRQVVGIGFYGAKIHFHQGCRGGWDIFGPERVITRSNGNVLYEIDDEPALDLYKKYLGSKAADLPSSGLLFPLQIRSPLSTETRITRTILNIDEKNHALIFAGDVPEGYHAQLMKANFERIIDGAAKAADASKELFTSAKSPAPQVVVAVSCVGRRLVLGPRAEEELEALSDVFGSGVPLLGFYSYGEIAASDIGKACDLQNQTMTLLALSEG
jgi:hypothetical protein